MTRRQPARSARIAALPPPDDLGDNRSLQQLFRWLAEDDEIDRSPMEKMSPPSVPEQPVPVLSDNDLAGVLAAAKGNTFEHRRDTAILRLSIDTGMRAGELIGLTC